MSFTDRKLVSIHTKAAKKDAHQIKENLPKRRMKNSLQRDPTVYSLSETISMQHCTLNSVSDQYRAPKPGRMWMPNKNGIASEPNLH